MASPKRKSAHRDYMYAAREAPRSRSRRSRSWDRYVKPLALLAVFAILVVGWFMKDSRGSSVTILRGGIVQTPSQNGAIYYRTCADARSLGAGSIPRGAPGYRSALDADSDGIACEPYP